MTRAERAKIVLRRLKRAYPDPRCALDHEDAFQLMVATILSAQCTDERVNMVTPKLFARFPDAEAMAAAVPAAVEDLIRSTGFFRNKTKSLLGASIRIRDEYGGRVPDTMADLLTLPGVARKTANVILGNAFGKNEGVVVDTHVGRLARRIGLSGHTDPVKVEKDLMKHFPRAEWTNLSHRLIDHGRRVCVARWPRCLECTIGKAGCRSYEPDVEKWKAREKRRRTAGA
jgi:endonuclease-3